MVKVIVHIDTYLINNNRLYKRNDPVISVTREGRTLYARKIELTGPSVIVHNEANPLDSGAVCWLETHFPVQADEWFEKSELEPYRPKQPQ
jgi:hypothetical protein